jgi:glycosyltransferase involved in cell wall biosynthesis
VRILIFHGYLLEGTGSNVYNARLAAALVRLGHEVHLLCQDRQPERQPFVDACADWDTGRLRVRVLREPVGCTVYRPDIGTLLPVYVADRYEGIEARTFAQCSEAELALYIDANVLAVRDVAARTRPDVALANHLVMGPVILARGLAGVVPYAVKVLEYTVKPCPRRFLGFAREGVAQARAILVGSRHTAESLWTALGDAGLAERTRLGPPGVDVERFTPREERDAAAGVRALASRLSQPDAPGGEDRPASAFTRDARGAARAISRLDPERDRLVAFVGKLIVSKGVDLLLAAWPLVLERVPRARLVVVGFGAYRAALERLLAALCTADMKTATEIGLAGRALEAGDAEEQTAPARPLQFLLDFFEHLDGERQESYLRAAGGLEDRVVLTGRLDHEELVELLPACEALVVPSTFPESFGMVAVEAAACGALPISAAHSGLAEVGNVLAGAVGEPAAAWLSFPIDDGVVEALAERVIAWLEADATVRSRTRAALARTAHAHWSWEGVGRGVMAAARGELDALREP